MELFLCRSIILGLIVGIDPRTPRRSLVTINGSSLTSGILDLHYVGLLEYLDQSATGDNTDSRRLNRKPIPILILLTNDSKLLQPLRGPAPRLNRVVVNSLRRSLSKLLAVSSHKVHGIDSFVIIGQLGNGVLQHNRGTAKTNFLQLGASGSLISIVTFILMNPLLLAVEGFSNNLSEAI